MTGLKAIPKFVDKPGFFYLKKHDIPSVTSI